MVTLASAKASRLQRVAGTCSNTDDFLDLVNEATRMLMNRGNWWNTVKRVQFCSYNNCLTFPRQVGTLLALNTCGRSIPPKNNWYNFSDVLPEDVTHWQQNGHGFGGCNHGFAAVDSGTTSVFNQIPCNTARYVRFYVVQPGDAGKTITIFGIDGNGQTVRTLRADGTFQDGAVLTLAVPFVNSGITLRRLDRVIKDPTDGPIYGYQDDGTNLYDLAYYEASETLPEYRTNCIETGGCAKKQYTALVKLQFIPVQHDDDLVLIDNLDALAMMIQALKQSDAYDHQGAEVATMRAVKELNLELRNKLPIAQTPARVHYQGGASLLRQRIGYII